MKPQCVLAFPAMCPIPLSQTLQQRYSQSCATRTGCTVAQPTSVFQNHKVVAGVERSLHASMCGSYHSARDPAVWLSPGKPPTPYGPSEIMQVGVGQSAYWFSARSKRMDARPRSYCEPTTGADWPGGSMANKGVCVMPRQTRGCREGGRRSGRSGRWRPRVGPASPNCP